MKKIIQGTFTALLVLSANCFSQQPYDSIRHVPYEPYFLSNSYLVSYTLSARDGTTFIDVGSHNGAAARYIAQNTDDSVAVFSVNPWEEEGSFQAFLSNVIDENTADKISPFKMSSSEAAEAFNFMADVIYFDTSDPSSLAHDITVWFSHLNGNGAMCGDNLNHNAVSVAVWTAASNLDLTVDVSGSFWTMHR